jgi:hypothetical protein
MNIDTDNSVSMEMDIELNESDWLRVKQLGTELQDRLVLCKTVHNFKNNTLYLALETKDFSSAYKNSKLDNVPTLFQCGFKKCKQEFTASQFLEIAENYKSSIKTQKRTSIGTPNRNNSKNKNWHEMSSASSDTSSSSNGNSDSDSIVFTTQAPPTQAPEKYGFVPVPDSSVRIMSKKVSLPCVSKGKKVSHVDVPVAKTASVNTATVNTDAIKTTTNAVNLKTVKKQLFKIKSAPSSDSDSSFSSTGTFMPSSNSKFHNHVSTNDEFVPVPDTSTRIMSKNIKTTVQLKESETIQENIYLKQKITQLENQINSLASQVGLLTNQLSTYISSKTIPPTTTNQLNSSANVPAIKSLPTIPSQTTSVQPLSWAAITALPNPTTHARLKAKENAQHPDRKEGFEALRNLIVKSQPKKSKESMPTAVLHVAGLPFVKYSVIWNLLRRARFQTSRIYNMQWIGKSIVEFIVDETYKIQFEAEIMEFRGRIIKFDPSKNVKASTPEQATHAKRCFVIRCIKNILYTQNFLVKNHFEKLVNDAQESDPETKLLMDEEMKKGLETKQISIDSLVSFLTSEEMEASIYKSKITDLRRLAANHPLVLSYTSNSTIAPTSTSTNIITASTPTTTDSITVPTISSTTADGGSTEIGNAAMDIDNNDPSGDY